MITMTISDKDWTRAEILAGWLDDEKPAVAEEAADTEIAYLILHTWEVLGSGWIYQDGTFSGPYRGGNHNPVSEILQLVTQAVDYTVEHLDEIRATED